MIVTCLVFNVNLSASSGMHNVMLFLLHKDIDNVCLLV